MNNWDKRPNITVVYGADDLPIFAIEAVLKDVMKDTKHWESMNYSCEDGDIKDLSIVNTSNIAEEDHLVSVIECLRDHLHNVDRDSWMSHKDDLEVAKEDNLLVEVYYGIYHGPNCDVHTYYVTI